jgi:hypothetical protein
MGEDVVGSYHGQIWGTILGQDFKPGSPANKTGELPTWSQCLMWVKKEMHTKCHL